MCTTQQRRAQFPEAYMAIKVEQDINRYCKRIGKQVSHTALSKSSGRRERWAVACSSQTQCTTTQTTCWSTTRSGHTSLRFSYPSPAEQYGDGKQGFWGGEAELLILSKMLKAPIKVYIKNQQGPGYLCIVHYGEKFDKANGGKRKPVRLLYNGSNQYVLCPSLTSCRQVSTQMRLLLLIAFLAPMCDVAQLRPPPRSLMEGKPPQGLAGWIRVATGL
jgi:hypothetical protein